MEMVELLARGLLTQAVAVAARLRIADLVAEGPRSAAELAEATGTRPDALARLLRALVGLEVLALDDDGRFAATPRSRALEAGPGSIGALAELIAELSWRAWGALGHSVATGEPAFRHEYGQGMFDHLAGAPEAARVFQSWMTEQSNLQEAALLEAIDLAGVGRLIDVGGGRGTLLAALLRANPDLRGALYDRPEVAATAEALAAPDIAHRAEAIGGDFFASVPEGADRYVLKLVIHDWDDERAITILEAVRRAIPAGGRLLLIEHPLPEGDGYGHAVWLDINMLVMTDGGRERTVAEYRDLLARAGFALTRVIPTRGPIAVIEAAPG
jgi:DNA-binding transcriptional ArsR family regulator